MEARSCRETLLLAGLRRERAKLADGMLQPFAIPLGGVLLGPRCASMAFASGSRTPGAGGRRGVDPAISIDARHGGRAG
jgi:hypothetical protein